VRKHREELRAKGLRPVTRWVPDTRSPEFQAEYRRQALAWADHLRTSPEAKEEVAYWESMAIDPVGRMSRWTLNAVTCNYRNMAEAKVNAKSASAKDRVRKHREALRAQGLRPVTRWVPDTRSAEFQAEYRRQALAWADYLRTSPKAKEEGAYWESMASDQGWV
jgi:hypothetical protein